MNDNLKKTNEKFEKAINKLAGVLGGKEHLGEPTKFKTAEIKGLVEELLEERTVEAKAKVKLGLRKALDGYVALEKELKTKRAELDKLETQKKEEYIKTIEELGRSIEDINEMGSLYAKGLDSEENKTIVDETAQN